MRKDRVEKRKENRKYLIGLKRKRILLVASEFPPLPGGIGNHAYHLALNFYKKGYSVTVITDQRVQDSREATFDANLPFTVKRIALKRFRMLMYLQRMYLTLIYVRQCSTVVATGKFSLWNVAFSRLFYKVPNLAVIHGSEVNLKSRLLQGITQWALKRFDRLIAVSRYTKTLVDPMHPSVIVIPNGIDVLYWQSPVVGSFALSGNPVLTTVGRVSLRKGQQQVIKHLPALLAIYPNIHYHCIGISTEAAGFMDEAEKLGVSDHVTFHGAVSSTVLKQALAATDIFVMLSAESASGDVEGFGIAILEANALGVPAIGALGCGIEDAIQSGKTGYLIHAKDTSGFQEAIDNILSSKPNFETHCTSWAQEHDWSLIINDYISFLP